MLPGHHAPDLCSGDASSDVVSQLASRQRAPGRSRDRYTRTSVPSRDTILRNLRAIELAAPPSIGQVYKKVTPQPCDTCSSARFSVFCPYQHGSNHA